MFLNPEPPQSAHRPRRYLRPSDCMERLRCGKTKLYELIAEGKLPISKLGRATLIAEEDLAELMDGLPSGYLSAHIDVEASQVATTHGQATSNRKKRSGPVPGSQATGNKLLLGCGKWGESVDPSYDVQEQSQQSRECGETNLTSARGALS